jgi:signal transduction histidine kinase
MIPTTSNNKKVKILYIDDEQENLSSFKASFSRHHTIDTTSSVEEALNYVDSENPHIVIADQRMPNVSGVEFFERLRKKNPHPQRVLLTAYLNSQTLIDAINRGQIDKFLLKPWDKEAMLREINKLYDNYQARVKVDREKQELDRVNKDLNRFVYSVTHDLRAPLKSIMGLIDICSAEENPELRQVYFSHMRDSIVKTDDFIQTTLQYYKNLKTDLVFEPFNVLSSVKDITTPLSSYNERVKFEINVPEDIEINTDRVRFRIAVSNILTNAVKYGFKDESSPYTIKISAHLGEELFKLSIADQGKGISSEHLNSIFEMFSSEESSQTVESSGIGLHLVKQAVEKIGGEVTVRSKVGVGSEFEIRIPVKSMKML